MNIQEMEKLSPAYYREKLPEFKEKTLDFYDKKMNLKDYKGFSGRFGSYAQRGGNASMLRLRMTGGRLTKEKLKFLLDACKEHDVNLAHFTTCQAVQLHNLQPEAVFDIMDKALDVDIVTYGGGGDYPRNVMCSPLSGVETGEYLDVIPYALAAGDFMMHLIDGPKMPRKLKVAFSNSPANEPHATFRDLGFVARPDGNFDVYAAGGLGVNPKLGVKVAENVAPQDILYYIKAMIETFKKHGNYQNRTKARTRFMVEALGSEEAFIEAFAKELEAVRAEDQLTLENVEVLETSKQGDGEILEEDFQIIPQKQPGLYAVKWHPLGGSPNLEVLQNVYDAIVPMEDVEIRLAPDESAYVINLTAREAKKIQEILAEDNARNPFETSVSCIGASICQVGVRDSQGTLKKLLQEVRKAGLPDNVLPQIHISGCPSSCGTHQSGPIGFRGGVKLVNKKPVPAYTLFVDGVDVQGKERLAREVGSIAEEQIPEFLIKLGRLVQNSGKSFEEWFAENPEGIDLVAAGFIG